MSQPIGRGRAKGRGDASRGTGTGGQPARPGSSQPPPQAAAGAWRGGVGDGGAGRATQRAPQAQGAASLSTRMAAVTLAGGNGGNGNGNGGNGNGNGGNGNGNGASTVGRAALRGRRAIGPSEFLRTRPSTCESKTGSSGNPVALMSNYFEIKMPSSWTLYQYRVDFKIEEDRPHVLKAWLKEVKDSIGLTGYLFDGTVLFTPQRLSAGKEVIEAKTVRKTDNTVVIIELRLVSDVQSSDIHGLQVWGILLRRCLGHLNLQLIGRNFFDPVAKMRIDEYKLEVWPGYITSIRQHDRGILLCNEIAHKVMRTDTVFNLLKECIEKNPRDYQKLFQQAIVGQIVLTDYTSKTYRVDDVDFSKTPSSTFPKRDGSQMSFVEYYKTKYNITIRDAKQPLLVSRAKAKDIRGGRADNILLIPELCCMTGITDEMRADFKLMKALNSKTKVSPSGRMDRLKNFRLRLKNTPAIVKEFQDWGLTIADEIVRIPGRVLAKETIVAGNNRLYKPDHDYDWTKDLRSNPMLTTVPVKSWVIITTRRLENDAKSFAQTLMKAAGGMSFNLPRPSVMATPDDKGSTMYEATDHAVAQHQPDLIMYCVSNNRADRYAAVKKKCIVERGILSQVVTAKSIQHRGVMSIATKVAIQINAKLGGAPWTTEIPLNGLMVVGYDACHEPGSKKNSVGALVASLNKPLSRWFSVTTQHTSGEELCNAIALNLIKAIREYEASNGSLPTRIVFYRDGVGEGQLEQVYHHEVEAIKAKLTEVYGGPNYKLAFIVVTKRINTRLFRDGANAEPGTVVDDAITNPEKYDFFLVSQTVREGTVTPTGYNVISDNVGLTPDQIQRLTYKMTHLYYNWSGTVRVPAPCQYSHKLAFLVSQHLHTAPHRSLQNYLYYL